MKKIYQIIDVIFCIISLLFRHIKEEFEDLFSEDDLMQMEHDQIAFTWYTWVVTLYIYFSVPFLKQQKKNLCILNYKSKIHILSPTLH